MNRSRNFTLSMAVLFFVFLLTPRFAVGATVDCPPEPAVNTAITDGEVIAGANCTLKSSGDIDSFTFSGTKGETYQLAAALSGTIAENICLTLYDPNLKIVYGPGCTSYPLYSITTDVTLATTGTYTIDLTEPVSGTQNYAFSLERLHPFPPNAQSVKLATVYSEKISTLTQPTAFTFGAVTTGEYEVDLFLPPNPTANMCLTVYSPSGALITPTTGTEGGCTSYPQYTTIIDFTPTEAGTYMAFISASGNDGLGSYSLEISCLVGNCVPPPPSCTLSDALSYNATTSTLTMNFTVGNSYAANWHTWLIHQNGMSSLFNVAQPITVPPATITKTATLAKSGKVGVLSTLSTATKGIVCSSWQQIATPAP